MSYFSKSFNQVFLILFLLILTTACNEDESKSDKASKLVEVDVAPVLHETIVNWDEYTGRVKSPDRVTVIPRVSGYLDKVMFDEGARVKKGDVLFQVDPRTFKTDVQRLESDLDRAKANSMLAESEYKRVEELYKQRAVSKQTLESQYASKQKAKADVNSIKAQLAHSTLDLEFTKVIAPIDGRVSFAQITEGNYLEKGVSPLTSIVSDDYMHVYFDVDEKTYLKYLDLLQSMQQSAPGKLDSFVSMSLVNANDFKHKGKIDFIDNRVNSNTGTIRLRAHFNNRHQRIIPGAFATLRIAGSTPQKRILIDETAVKTDLQNRYVLLVDDNNQLKYQPVTLGKSMSGLRVIKTGLKPTDRIVINGMHRAKAGRKINPIHVDMTSKENLDELRKEQKMYFQ
ncbi:efflux transporter periplasmic adaptor subunit [Shewanella sp. OPT22]|nr:efflux transporter periplasmic adaptor subunit [Shewanella sp. OPT22]